MKTKNFSMYIISSLALLGYFFLLVCTYQQKIHCYYTLQQTNMMLGWMLPTFK